MAPVTEPPWVRQGSGVAARNGTATHTIPFGWTSAPGNELVVVVFGAVAHTAAGWTERLQPVNTGELSVFTRTSAGDDSITVTHNGADYPVLWVVYEFPAGTTWVNGASNAIAGDAFPQLTGLPGREVVVVAARGRVAVETTATAASSVWTSPWTADADLFEPDNGSTDGAYLTVGHQINVTSATVIPSAASSYTGAFASDREHVVFAVEVPAASGVTGTLTGALPVLSGTLSGAVSASAALSAALPEATAQLAGSVTAAGSLTGTLPALAVSLTGTLTTAGTLAGTLPALTGLLRQGRAVVPRPDAGTVTRPDSGTVTRPFAGIIHRP